MCGVVGYVGKRPVLDLLVKGLKRLEYRGYDSAGVAYFDQDQLKVQKSEGKIVNVEKLLAGVSPKGLQCGIGHTRWATHGKPTTQNAHPHRTGHVVLVHNGIIENYLEIKADLKKKGYEPASETDSELFGFLVLDKMNTGKNLLESVRESFKLLHGFCSVVVMSDQEPGKFVAVRNGTPLVAARDPQGGAFLASDAQALLEYTKEVVFLEDGDVLVGDAQGIQISTLVSAKDAGRKSTTLNWSADKMDKQGYDHYMLKEIMEQPMALIDTLNSILDRARTDPFPLAEQPGVEALRSAKEFILAACGTSWHASLLGKYWLERWGGVPATLEYSSELRYRDPVIRPGSVLVGTSQSGETADTLAIIKEMRRRGIPTMSITNVRGSTISRECNHPFFTSAGPEFSVAATKSFFAQALVFLLWSGHLGLRRTKDIADKVQILFDQLIKLPHLLEVMLKLDGEMVKACEQAAKKFQNAKGFFFIGRGYSFPIALEGALKLKEIAYVHSEGYPAGELKHGPIAMIDKDMVSIVLVPQDAHYEKTVSNLQELKARGSKIIGIGNANDQKVKKDCDVWIPIPVNASEGNFDESLYPFLLVPAVQLFSYYMACLKGTDVDQPRNLAKSVTVE